MGHSPATDLTDEMLADEGSVVATLAAASGRACDRYDRAQTDALTATGSLPQVESPDCSRRAKRIRVSEQDPGSATVWPPLYKRFMQLEICKDCVLRFGPRHQYMAFIDTDEVCDDTSSALCSSMTYFSMASSAACQYDETN